MGLWKLNRRLQHTCIEWTIFWMVSYHTLLFFRLIAGEQFHAKVDKSWRGKNEVALFPALISLTDWFSPEYVHLEKGFEFHCIYLWWLISYFWNNATISK